MKSTNRNPDAGGAGALSECVPDENERTSNAKTDGPQPLLIGEFPANARETARVTLENYKGHDLVCIRKWYPGDNGGLRPGRDGIAVNVRHLPRLAELITTALEAARHSALLPSEGSPQ
jgi:hypothetical protein